MALEIFKREPMLFTLLGLRLAEELEKLCIPDQFSNTGSAKSIAIHILKVGKDPTNPVSYRPIALTSNISKTMERMINRRLVLFLESHKLLTNV